MKRELTISNFATTKQTRQNEVGTIDSSTPCFGKRKRPRRRNKEKTEAHGSRRFFNQATYLIVTALS
jgi:hypothetical protein